MLESFVNLIKLDTYSRLIRDLVPNSKAIGIVNRTGRFIWTDDKSLDKFHDVNFSDSPLITKSASEIDQKELESGDILISINLSSYKDNTVDQLLVLADKGNSLDSEEAKTTLNDILNTIREIILNELELNSELELMAEELSSRYEELNLVYGRDNTEKDIYLGVKSLQQLVKSCTNFLDVGISALIIPDKNISIYDFNKSSPIPHPHNLQPQLTTNLYNWISKNEQSIVINDATDPLRHELCPQLPYKILASPVSLGESKIIGVIAIFNTHLNQDYTNSDRNLLDVVSKKASKIIQTCFDALTGLENAVSFEWKLNEALTQARLEGRNHMIINLDINQTKVINDISGREAGDALICAVGQVIEREVRNRDSVARLMGDKFGILLENCPIDVATQLAEKLRIAINAIEFEWKGETYDVSSSIGVASISAESDSVASIITSVEVARDAAKERGRNQMQIFEDSNVDLLRRRDEMHWVGRIHSAVRENRLVLHSQLIQPLQPENTNVHYEILIRMLDEDGKIVMPGEFLPAAEHYYMMPLIDRWVVKQSLEMLSDNSSNISINLSGQSLCDEGFQQFVIDLIDSYNVDPEQICFEITESAAIANMKEAKQFIEAIKIIGCSFSLDDFGTGLSSFSYLKNLNVDYLKIDGSFVRELVDDPVSDTMVMSIHQIGKSMGIKTVAEFVENLAIRDRLVEMGVDYAQGYGLGKPRPFQDQLVEIINKDS